MSDSSVYCSYSGFSDSDQSTETLGARVAGAPSPRKTLTAVVEASDAIHRLYGLQPNVKVSVGQIPLQVGRARIKGVDRFIEVDERISEKILDKDENRRALESIVAHELGHIFQGHTLLGASTPRAELEADEFAGGVLYRLGATLEESQAALRRFTSVEGTDSHPARAARLSRTRKGWRDARERDQLEIRQARYAATMRAAYEAYERDDALRLTRLLTDLLPAPGESDVRDFAWYHYWRLLHEYEDKFTAGAGRPVAFAINGPLPPLEQFWNARALRFTGPKRLVSAEGGSHINPGELVIRDLGTATVSRRAVRTNVVDVTPDGRFMAIAEVDDSAGQSYKPWYYSIAVLDLSAGNSRKFAADEGVFDHAGNYVKAVALSRNGKRVAAGLGNRTARIWDVETAESVDTRDLGSAPTALLFSPDGKALAIGTANGRLFIWVAGTPARERHRSETGASMALASAQEGALVAVADRTEVVALWRWSGNDLRSEATIKFAGMAVRVVALSSDGLVMAVGDRGSIVRVYDRSRGESRRLHGHVNGTIAIAFNTEDHLLATADSGIDASRPEGLTHGQIRIWDWRNRRGRAFELRRLGNGEGRPRSVAMGAQKLLSTLHPSSREFGTWDLSEEFPEFRRIGSTDSPIDRLAISPDGSLAVTVDGDLPGNHANMTLWQLPGGEKIELVHSHSSFRELRFGPDSHWLAIASDDFLSAWDLTRIEDKEVEQLALGAAPGGSFTLADRVRISAGGKFLAGISPFSDWTKIWDPVPGILSHQFHDHRLGGSALALSDDGRWVATAGEYDWNIVVRELSRQRALRVLTGHRSAPEALSFDAAGNFLASAAGEDEPIWLWDLETGAPHSLLPAAGVELKELYFGKDGLTLVGVPLHRAFDVVWWRAAEEDEVHDFFDRRRAKRPERHDLQLEYVRACWARYLAYLKDGSRDAAITQLDDCQSALDSARRVEDPFPAYQSWLEELHFAREELYPRAHS